MAEDPSNSMEFRQKQFEDAYAEIQEEQGKVSKEAKGRRIFAYFLKGVAVFGGIAIGAGLSKGLAQSIGIAISVGVAVDVLFSNHLRLITVTKAVKAYARLLKEVRRTHTTELGPILALKTTNETEARAKLEDLIQKLIGKLHAESRLIETALDEVDIKALNALILDPNAGSQSSRPSVG